MMEQFDQTLFTEEEPLFESKQVSGDSKKPTSEKVKKPPVLLFILIPVVLVAIVIGAIIFTNSPTPQNQLESSPSPSPSLQTGNTYLDQLFNELSDDIDNADPLENILPFPPVEESIQVSPIRN